MKSLPISKLLIVIMVLLLMMIAGYALADNVSASGEYGNLEWELKDGVLTISGNGDMDYVTSSEAWRPYSLSIKTVVISDGVTSIGFDAFYECSNLTNISIPVGVTSIEGGAFASCNSLTSIAIPDSVTYIGSNAFNCCRSLTDISLPDNVFIESCAFLGCSSLTSIIIPDGVKGIATETFNGCSSLTSISISDSVTYIGDSAFAGCRSLKNISIPDSVTSIGNWSFEDCSSLTSIAIPDSVTNIGDGAFRGCSNLSNINIPDNVTTIGRMAFEECESLTSIVLPNGITRIEAGTFQGCYRLENIKLPANLTSVGSQAFEFCYCLKSISLPDTVLEIGDTAFRDCKNLFYVKLSESLTRIEDSAFYGCERLSTITIPESVQTIGDYAFTLCSDLTSIVIPENVLSIGEEAFCLSYVYSSEKIYFMGKNTIICNSTLSILATIYCYSDSNIYEWATLNGRNCVLLDSTEPAQLLAISIPETLNIPVDRETQMPVNIFPIEQIDSIEWTSSDESILQVNQEGFLTPVTTGAVYITVTIDGKMAKSKVTVYPVLTDVVLPEEIFVLTSDTFFSYYRFTIQPQNAISDFIILGIDSNYISYPQFLDNNRIALQGKNVGETTIKIRDRISGIEKTVNVHVCQQIEAASFVNKSVSIQVGQTYQLETNVVIDQHQINNQGIGYTAD